MESLVLALLLAACGGVDERATLTAAERRLDRDDVNGAVIDVRNLLKDRPESGPGRLMLGRALLAAGDLDNAVNELTRAQAFGQPDASVVPVLAAALLAQRKASELLSRFKDAELTEPAAQAALRTLVARAHLETGDSQAALAVLDGVLAQQPRHTDALILKARLTAAAGAADDARRVAAELLAREPANGQVWHLHADLLAQQADRKAEATAAYRKALELRPRLVEAHANLISLLLDQGDLPGATEQADRLAKALPNTPIADFYLALTDYMAGDFVRVREHTQRLARGQVTDPRALFLGGMAEMRLGALASAETMLAKAVSAMPDAVEPRRELAGLHVRLIRPGSALDTLRPLLDADTQDSGAWRYAGLAHALAGDFRNADAAFAKAAKLQPGDVRVRMALGQSLIARGQADAGLREIRAAAEADTTGVDADMALISALMRRKDTDGALAVVDRLQRKRPDAAMPDLLRGRILEQAGDLRSARAAYEKSLERDPKFLQAVTRLAQIEVGEGRIDGARKLYQNLLKREPRAAEAMIAMAGLTLRAGGALDAATEWVDKAVAAQPTDAETWRSAINFHRAAGDNPGALSRARAAAAAVPDNFRLLTLVAETQVVAGDVQQAVATAQRLVQLQPESPGALTSLAGAYLAAGNLSSARQQVTRALTVAPQSPGVLRTAIAIELRDKSPAAAQVIARKLQFRQPALALGWQLEGEVAATLNNWSAAVAALRTAMTKGPSTQLAIQLHTALLNSGQEPEAARVAQQWQAAHKEDSAFLVYLAESAARQGDWPAAEARYRELLKAQPKSPALLNNLAGVLLKKKDPEALSIALMAVKQAPHVAAIIDTVALAYAQSNDLGQAIAWQSKAVVMDPRRAAYRIQLVRLHLRAGDKGKAREEISRLEQLGPGAASAEELAKLKIESRG